ncbi:MAG TPA: polyprenyl synthetase family protein [Amycolatopsis sp.]|uniref:polyprenyl synthetase family protein n=1 Tax=Amycolatopsis sp. TaxID=37632 RepID=UPI002B475EEA|nr:polyprenyl synthetase family protein [Amycolatopsis sp.]HKS48357.1 polyprenyl synthetase family protein [Amycolatopsis sp.]
MMLREMEQGLLAFLTDERVKWVADDERAAVPVQAVTKLVKAGGKRLRPAFCLTGYFSAGGQMPAERAVRAAIALELLHASALIHDDVMDDSDQRRAMPTVHAEHIAVHRTNGWHGESRRYGESVAILAGDLAWAYADYFMADLSADLSRQWLELRAELVSGQLLDIATATEFTADPELARRIAVVKSGRYTIHRPLVLGSTLAGRSDLADHFEVYGEALGEAFQLRDDLIDAFEDGKKSGKPSGLDFRQHKMTVLLSLAVRQDERIRSLVENGEFDLLRERLILCGIRDKVEARIGELVERAQCAIGEAPLVPDWREQLSRMATEVAYRST